MNLSSIFNSKQIRGAAIGSILIKFLSAFFALINGILLAQMLSVEDFGIYILAFTTILVITIPVSLGLPELLTRYVSKYDTEKNFEAMKGLLIRSNQIVLVTSFIAILIAFILYLLWWKNYSETIVITFWYSLVLLPVLVFGALRAATLRGLKYVVLGQMPDTFLRNLFLTLALVIVYFFNLEITPQKAMFFHCIAAVVAFFIGYLFLEFKILKTLRSKIAIFETKFWLKEATPFAITGGVQILKTRSLTYLLAIFGSLEAVAIFDVAMRGASLVSFTVDALNKAISPYISSAFELQQKKTLQRIIKKTARLIFILSIPIALIFIIGGEAIVSWLFGNEYIASYIPLIILCIGHIVNALSGPLAAVLNMTGNQTVLSKNQILMMITSILLSIPLIYYYNVLGAAVVFSVVLLIQNSLLYVFTKRKLKLDTTVF
ncbi:oligosaccharide flippase family protein [Jejudonia soesokkakensis]|uniref:Oligosaccharide flippase family protein n=1 Tax=Jejudonia soesokkakensis TaxID=1323432 RepID=A0ABW2MXD3_9FLAO